MAEFLYYSYTLFQALVLDPDQDFCDSDMASVQLKNVQKSYDGKTTVIHGIDLEIQLNPDMERIKVAEVLHNSAELRSDVRELADAYNIVLTDEQTRSDV